MFLNWPLKLISTLESKLKSGKISASEMAEFEKDGARIESRSEELEAEPSSAQEDRAEQLTKRLAVVMEGMMVKMTADLADSLLEGLGLDGLLNEGDSAANDLPQRITSEVDGAEMVLIPAGSFEMGDSKNEPEEWMENTRPVHTVTLDAFYMDVYEVTNAQYSQFVRATGYRKAEYWDDDDLNQANQSVVGVSWNDAMAYAEWAGKRLPTEAEWEYAARGGLKDKRYSWGDEEPIGVECNFADKNVDEFLREVDPDWDWAKMDVDDGHEFTAPVGSFKPNGYGLYDMAGNVWEWCADWYGEDYYSDSSVNNPQGPETCSDRVLRGGSWYDNTYYLRLAARNAYGPNNRFITIGFRCVSGSN